MNIMDALNAPLEAAQKPPVLPMGTYVWSVSGPFTERQTNNGDWNIIEFPVVAVEADEDVDPEQLEAFGSLRAARNRITFMFPTDPEKDADAKRTLYSLRRFLEETLRVEASPDQTFRETLSNAVNHQFRAQAVWRPVENDTYVDLKNWMPVE